MIYARIVKKKVKVERQTVDGYYLELFGLQFSGSIGYKIYDDYMQIIDSPETNDYALMAHEIYSFLAKHEFVPVSEIFFYKSPK